MPEFAVPTVFSVVDRLTPFFSKGEQAASKFETLVSGAFHRTGREASTFQQILGGVTLGNLAARGIQAAASKVKEMASSGLELASSLVEVQNVVDTTFGSNASKIDAWSRTTMSAFGLSELQAKQFAGTLGAMLKSSGLAGSQIVQMSTDLSGLSGDLASFYNLPIETAFEKIRSGISGETEPLKQLGINMSVANLQAFALTQGMTKQYQKMTQAEQAQLRYSYLMKTAADAQGDFAKTLDTSYANQKRVLQTNMQQTAAAAMSAVLPLSMRFTKELNSITSRLGSWISANKDLIATRIDAFFNRAVWAVKNLGPPILAAVVAYNSLKYGMLAAAAAGKIFGLVSRIMEAYQLYAGGAASAQEALNLVMNANPVGLIVAGVSILVGLFTLLAIKTGGVKNAFTILGQTILKALLTPINLAMDAIQGLLSLVAKIPGLGKFAKGAASGIESFQDGMNKTLTGSSGAFDYKGAWDGTMSRSSPRTAPNAAAIEREDSRFAGRIDVFGPAGTKASGEGTRSAHGLRLEYMGANP